jgi:U3 small nucleolar ribonucleoprotein protein LCP5
MSAADSKEESKSAASSGLEETLQKVYASLQPSIESHVTADSFSNKDGLDFLDVKNSLLLSYLIDITVYIRDKNNGTANEKNLRRLTEMKTVLDKMRGLDKKLRYQLDKLMAASTTATSFAAGGDNPSTPEDPLQFRPDLRSLDQDDNSQSDSDPSPARGDDDLEAARATLSVPRLKNYRSADRDNDEDDDGIYRAPRLASVPYTHDQENKQKEKDKQVKRRMRASELAQTLRSQYGDAPEQEDIYGGGDYGKQKEAARRLAEREEEKTRYEESAMVRLTTSRKEKKESKRLMRAENSNLSAMTDLGNVTRGITASFGDGDDGDDDEPDIPVPGARGKQRYDDGRKQPYDNGKQRHDNGKRKREQAEDARMEKGFKTKNSLQSALYGTEGGKSSGKSKNKKSRR